MKEWTRHEKGVSLTPRMLDPENLIPQLYRWAESVAANFKNENSILIPIALNRLKELLVRFLSQCSSSQHI
uniref:Uncharacterized protein n=1 Tax=Parascaris equorum TaxID=6256 RepID=A0A914S6F8_PAREQ